MQHQKGFKVKFFPVSLKLPFPLEISLSLLKEVIKFKAQEKTIWHLDSYYLFMYDFITPVLFLKRQKFIMHYWGGGPSFTPKAILYTLYHYLIGLRITLNLATFVSVQNHSEEKRVAKFLFVKKEKILYIPNSMPKDTISDPQLLERDFKGTLKMMFAGRIEKIKNKSEVIAMLKRVLFLNKNSVMEFIGVRGKDKDLDELQKSCPNQVQLTGWITKKELVNKFREAHLYFHFNTKSTFEGSPGALVEAQSQGLPIIAFDIEGVKDIVKNDFTGYLVKNLKEFEKTLNQALKDPLKIIKMKINCLNNVKEKFLEEKYFPKLVKIHQSLIKARER